MFQIDDEHYTPHEVAETFAQEAFEDVREARGIQGEWTYNRQEQEPEYNGDFRLKGSKQVYRIALRDRVWTVKAAEYQPPVAKGDREEILRLLKGPRP